MNKKLLAIWDRTIERERDAGRAWYPLARAFCDSIAFWTDTPIERVIAATSALSPRVEWSRNMMLVERLLKGEPITGLRASLTKANAIVAGRFPGATAFPVKTCPKTNSFYHNILNPLDARYVTIDRHAARASGRSSERFNYQEVSSEYIQCARHVGETPSAFQATIWTYTRTGGQFELDLKGNANEHSRRDYIRLADSNRGRNTYLTAA